MPFKFSTQELEKLKEITLFYIRVKALLLMAEEVDKDRKTNPQILLELRNAFDHLMRVFIGKFELKEKNDPEYPDKVMEKFFGHLYRAGYDILDWLSINLRDQIAHHMNHYSHEAINAVFPEYYRSYHLEAGHP